MTPDQASDKLEQLYQKGLDRFCDNMGFTLFNNLQNKEIEKYKQAYKALHGVCYDCQKPHKSLNCHKK